MRSETTMNCAHLWPYIWNYTNIAKEHRAVCHTSQGKRVVFVQISFNSPKSQELPVGVLLVNLAGAHGCPKWN